MKENGFSLVEIMVVLTLSSVVFLLVYSIISIGVRFFESFSNRVDFSIIQFVRDLEYELSKGEDFYVSNRMIIIKGEYDVKYLFGTYERISGGLKVRKGIIQKNISSENFFYLKDTFDVSLFEVKKESKKKVFVLFTSPYGRTLYEGYLP